MMKTDNQAPGTQYRPACSGNEPKHKALFWLLLVFAPMALVQSGAIVALLFALVVAGLWVLPERRGLIRIDTDSLVHWWLPMLLGYGLLSVSWARDSWEAFYDWWRVALILSGGWLFFRSVLRLEPAHCRYLLRGVLWGAALLMISLFVEWLGDGQLAALIKDNDTSNLLYTSRACALLAVLLWPLTVFCRFSLGITPAAVLFLLALVIIALLPILAASVAILAASIVFGCYMVWPRFTPRLIGGAFITLMLLAPLASLQSSRYVQFEETSPAAERPSSSWLHRLVIWEFFAERIQSSPWVGYGIGSAHGLGQVPAAFKDYQRIARNRGNTEIAALPPLHPHNAALQLWHDLGLVGVLGLCAWMWQVMHDLLQREFRRGTVAASLASLTAWWVIAGLSFGLWQKWWLASGVISLAICTLLLRGLKTQGNNTSA